LLIKMCFLLTVLITSYVKLRDLRISHRAVTRRTAATFKHSVW
jgi:hypothetical protein